MTTRDDIREAIDTPIEEEEPSSSSAAGAMPPPYTGGPPPVLPPVGESVFASVPIQSPHLYPHSTPINS